MGTQCKKKKLFTQGLLGTNFLYFLEPESYIAGWAYSIEVDLFKNSKIRSPGCHVIQNEWFRMAS